MNPDLSQLRDIHLPPAVSWWPPALGWWVLLILLLSIFGLAYFLHVRRRRSRWRRDALMELAQLRESAPERILRELSVLLRRVAISRYPRQDVAALTGEAWLSFLDRCIGDGASFRSNIGRALLSGPYASDAQVDTTSLLDLCERWIKRLPKGAA